MKGEHTNLHRKLSDKRWTRRLLVSIILGVGFIVLVNCIEDPHGILRTDFSKQYQEPNHRFAKIRYLLAHKDAYDSFIFGASRALQIDPGKIPGGRYYNMAYSEGIPQEHLEHIEFMLTHGITIKNLIITLDDFSCRVFPEAHRNIDLLQPHYLISGKDRITFYSEYFLKLRRIFPTTRDYWKANFTRAGKAEARKYFYDIYGSGRVICRTCDEEIERDPAKHAQDPRFLKPALTYADDNRAGTLESLRKIVAISRENGIHLTVLINPLHKTTYLATDLLLFSAFKKELAAITGYYDFSGLNTITTDNYYYYEASHFRPLVGDMILARIFGLPGVRVPKGFGVYVTANNVDSHIRKQQDELDKVRAKSPGLHDEVKEALPAH